MDVKWKLKTWGKDSNNCVPLLIRLVEPFVFFEHMRLEQYQARSRWDSARLIYTILSHAAASAFAGTVSLKIGNRLSAMTVKARFRPEPPTFEKVTSTNSKNGHSPTVFWSGWIMLGACIRELRITIRRLASWALKEHIEYYLLNSRDRSYCLLPNTVICSIEGQFGRVRFPIDHRSLVGNNLSAHDIIATSALCNTFFGVVDLYSSLIAQ